MDEHLKEHNPAAYDAIIRLREKEHTKDETEQDATEKTDE